jgi:hypothetical protein
MTAFCVNSKVSHKAFRWRRSFLQRTAVPVQQTIKIEKVDISHPVVFEAEFSADQRLGRPGLTKRESIFSETARRSFEKGRCTSQFLAPLYLNATSMDISD